uniref:Uncharacterized LOC105938237 n=1 Tax=Fundulus heteroclitus TaxID=8078 RepID=A0A3Q2QXL2_FUNHE
MKLLFFCTVMVLTTTKGPLHAWPDPTRGGSGVNLNGKMFTLGGYNGGLVIYSPYQPSPWATPTSDPTSSYTSGYYSTSTPSYTETNTGNTETSAPFTATKAWTPKHTTPKPTTRHHTPSWTTGPPTRGFSVCLRYITDSQGGSIFTLSPSSSRIRLDVNGIAYMLSTNGYNNVYFTPNVRFWSGLQPTMWTSVCITVDNVKGVAQIFRDSTMSIRKLLDNYNTWSGEPVIDFSGFEGQVTDVQMWDYPLRYKEVFYYMSSGYYGQYMGSVLNWSYISYSLRGKTLLEDRYEQQLKQLTRRRGHHLKGEENTRKLFHVEEESKGRKSFDF